MVRYTMFLTLLPCMIFPSMLSATTTPIPALDLPALTRGADLIVVAEVENVWEESRTNINIQGHSVPARLMVANLRKRRAIKGQYDQHSLACKFFMPEAFLGYKDIFTGQFGMFFLRAKQPQEYFILDPYYPFIVAALNAPPGAKREVFNQVVAEVANVLSSSSASLDQQKGAVYVLDSVKTTMATRALRRAVRKKDISIRSRAIAALLKRNDISVLKTAEEILLNHPQVDEKYLLNYLAFSLEGITDHGAIPILSRLLREGDIQVRRSAAGALRRMETSMAIEPLSNALNDSDQEVRYNAVLGLAVITGQSEWGASIPLYKKDEQRYLDYWREWVKNR